MDCIFCKIVRRELTATFVYEDEEVVAFEDIHPQAPVHTLVVPKKHIATINDLEDGEDRLAGRLLLTARTLAKQKGIAEKGYRLVFNCNAEGGQMVYHIHLHLLGGRPLGGKLCK